MRTRTSKRAITDSDDDQPIATSAHRTGRSQKPKKNSTAAPVLMVSDESADTLSGPSLVHTRGQKRTQKEKYPQHSPSPAESPFHQVNPLVSTDLPANFFRSPTHESRFRSSVVQKQAIYEKSIDLVLYHDSPLKPLFVSCGLSSMLFPPSVAYPRLVQQFYTNLEQLDDSYTSFVKGKSLFFTASDLGSILQIPYSGDCPYTLKGAINFPIPALSQMQTVMNNSSVSTVYNPKTIDVCPLACVLHKLLRYNLLPRVGGGADFTYQDLVVAAMVMKGLPFNFAQMMLHHMVSCVRQTKKGLPYSVCLTKLFQHFHISFANEVSVSVSDSFDPALLKQSHISLVNGEFIRTPTDVHSSVSPNQPSSPLPSTSSSSTEVIGLLNTILQNQITMQTDLTNIKHRLSILEKGKLPIHVSQLTKLATKFEDEFIDLQAGFELQTTAMVESLQQKFNRNTCQLSQELKFVSHQVGELADFTASRMNDVAHKLHFNRKSSSVHEWPHCNWMAEYRGDFLDVPLPDATYIPRPPRFAHNLSPAEREHRATHRPYFTKRTESSVHIEELD